MVTALIVAAGKGTRMRAALPKQVLPLNGRPLVEHSLRAFQRCDAVDRIVLVLSPEQRALAPLRLGRFDKAGDPVDGGRTRQESVRRGLEAATDAEWVLVHDAARPLVNDALIRTVLEAARFSGAAVPGCRVEDTIKQAEGGHIVKTLDRDAMIRVQTPQGFRADLLRRAHEEAAAAGFVGTDDAQLVERLGEAVAWVEGAPHNLKVTTADDLRLAEVLLRGGIA
jgi:2-C-methyl-D-erythritol 4-phosphate cytidylyltransferase